MAVALRPYVICKLVKCEGVFAMSSPLADFAFAMLHIGGWAIHMRCGCCSLFVHVWSCIMCLVLFYVLLLVSVCESWFGSTFGSCGCGVVGAVVKCVTWEWLRQSLSLGIYISLSVVVSVHFCVSLCSL